MILFFIFSSPRFVVVVKCVFPLCASCALTLPCLMPLNSVQFALSKWVLHVVFLYLCPRADFQGGPPRVDFSKP